MPIVNIKIRQYLGMVTTLHTHFYVCTFIDSFLLTIVTLHACVH